MKEKLLWQEDAVVGSDIERYGMKKAIVTEKDSVIEIQLRIEDAFFLVVVHTQSKTRNNKTKALSKERVLAYSKSIFLKISANSLVMVTYSPFFSIRQGAAFI